MRYELYSLVCSNCKGRNKPTAQRCAGCGGTLQSVLRCAHCQAENPPNAYVCLTCYRKLKEKPRVGILHCHMPWSVSVVLLAVVVGWFVYRIAAGCVAVVEAQQEETIITDHLLEMQRMERD